jgi:hypothetical protein
MWRIVSALVALVVIAVVIWLGWYTWPHPFGLNLPVVTAGASTPPASTPAASVPLVTTVIDYDKLAAAVMKAVDPLLKTNNDQNVQLEKVQGALKAIIEKFDTSKIDLDVLADKIAERVKAGSTPVPNIPSVPSLTIVPPGPGASLSDSDRAAIVAAILNELKPILNEKAQLALDAAQDIKNRVVSLTGDIGAIKTKQLVIESKLDAVIIALPRERPPHPETDAVAADDEAAREAALDDMTNACVGLAVQVAHKFGRLDTDDTSVEHYEEVRDWCLGHQSSDTHHDRQAGVPPKDETQPIIRDGRVRVACAVDPCVGYSTPVVSGVYTEELEAPVSDAELQLLKRRAYQMLGPLPNGARSYKHQVEPDARAPACPRVGYIAQPYGKPVVDAASGFTHQRWKCFPG